VSSKWKDSLGNRARVKVTLKRILPLLFLLIFVSCGNLAEQEKRPNIVLISIDSLRADHLGCYGYSRNTSPVIDQLARTGILFPNTFSTSSWTLPAHVSMLTSLDMPTHGVIKDDLKMGDNVKTLAQVLKNNGYATAGFISSVFVHGIYGFDRGFDTYEDLSSEPWIVKRNPDSPNVTEAIFSSVDDTTSPRLTRRVAQWLRENKKKAPVFLFVHYFDVHFDYAPPQPYRDMFDPDYTGTVSARNFFYNEDINPNMSRNDLDHVIALYDGEIRFVDEHIGKLLDLLKENCLDQNTILIITSDHGDEFFEHGHKGHQYTLYDEVLRIPLIIHWPGHLPEGKTATGMAGIIDIMPTVLDLAGINPPDTMMGTSLRTRIFGDDSGHSRSLLGELHCWDSDSHLFSLRTETAKIIYDSAHDKTAVYDLEKDPGEHRDVADDAGSRTPRKELEQQLHAALEHAEQEKKKWRIQELPLGKRTKAQEEKLKSLGYLK
jgi:arylsulfatase A-like enzyme